MSLPQGFSRVDDAVLTTTSAPEVLYDGLGALNTGAMCTTSDAPAFWPNGIPVTADGYVCITASPTLPVYYSNGMKFDATGRLVISTYAGSPSFSNAGLVFDADGNLVTINYGIYWPFAAYADANDGALVGPWNDLTRTGLGTRIGPAGLVEYGPHNIALNSKLAGAAAGSPGTAPTSWSLSFTGGSLSLGSVDADGNVPITFAATNARQVISQVVTVAANTTYRVTVQVSAPTPGLILVQALQAVSLPAGASVAYERNGAAVLNTEVVANGDSISIIVTVAATSGVFEWRLGCGCNSATTGAESCALSKPAFTIGALAVPYVPTTTSARYLPRIDYDPVTLASRGLLIEGAGTNLAPASGNASNAVWSKARCSAVANAATAPDGTLTASEIVEDTSTNTHEVTGVSVTLAANTQITAQIRVKRGAGTRNFRFTLYAGADGLRVTANLGTLAITNGSYGSSVFTSASITGPDVNGYYTVTCTGIPSTISANPVISWQLLDAAMSSFYTGNGSSSLIFGSIQIEAGPVATSYIPNPGTGTAVRAADDWYLSGGAFTAAWADVVTAGAGTVVVEFVTPDSNTNSRFVVCGQSGNHQLLYSNTGVNDWYAYDGVQALTFGTLGPGLSAKMALSFNGTSMVGCINGGAVASSAHNGGFLSLTQLRLGVDAFGARQLNSTIKSARVLPGHITGAALQALTA